MKLVSKFVVRLASKMYKFVRKNRFWTHFCQPLYRIPLSELSCLCNPQTTKNSAE